MGLRVSPQKINPRTSECNLNLERVYTDVIKGLMIKLSWI